MALRQEKEPIPTLFLLTPVTGDVIGDYSFENPVQIGDRLYFQDMAIYSFVKNNTFNGIGLPSLYLMETNRETVAYSKLLAIKILKGDYHDGVQ